MNFTHEIMNNRKNPNEVIKKTISAIQAVRNIEYIYEDRFTIPYLPTIFHEPFISKAVVSFNKEDSIQGAKYKFYHLEDTFRLKITYDGRYLKRSDDDSGKTIVVDLSQNPSSSRSLIGSIHLRTKALLEKALNKNANIDIVESNDSLKINIIFNDLQIEFAPYGTRLMKDTIGFVSQYTVYLDPHSYLPIKQIRKMPYQTSIETILYQKVNFTDTLIISALKNNDLAAMDEHNLSYDHSFENLFTGTNVKNWKLKEVQGDSLQFSDIKGKQCMIVFNSIGWRPCIQTIQFMKLLRNEYQDSVLKIISIEPFINDVGILNYFKINHAINYPLLVADPSIKKHYNVLHVPVFMMIDKNGVIKKIIIGFTGESTEVQVRKAIQELYY